MDKYTVLEKIGEGKFGIVYQGINKKTREKVAIKMETMNSVSYKIIKHEATIVNYLYSHKCRNIPPIYWYGKYTGGSTLVMPYYELPLDKYIKTGNRSTHSIKTIMAASIQILEQLHKNYVVHRDIKMANFMIQNNELVLIDFGMATFYVDENKNHILSRADSEKTPKTDILGTVPYISIRIHEGEEYSRRDDMISLAYMFLFMVFGRIFWNRARDSFLNELPQTHIDNAYNKYVKEEKNIENILAKIEQARESVDEDLVWCCKSYIDYVYRIGFYEKPSYNVEWLLDPESDADNEESI
jgi:serine/threonine protein kinase